MIFALICYAIFAVVLVVLYAAVRGVLMLAHYVDSRVSKASRRTD